MARRLLGVVIAVAGFVLSGCATMRVSSHVERGLDFSEYRTFDWGPRDALPVGDPRLDNNRFFSEHVETAVDQQLASRGFDGAIDNQGWMEARIDDAVAKILARLPRDTSRNR